MTEKYKIDPMLKLFLDMSGTNHLHFGLWNLDDEIHHKNFQRAQDRYMEHVGALIPKTVKRVLDVGAGVGETAKYLTKECQVSVHSLSPDPYQEVRYKENTNNSIPFTLSRFEVFDSDKTYDLVLFSESAQYIQSEIIFKRAQQLLPETGYILISDYFKQDSAKAYTKNSANDPDLPSYYWSDLLKQAEAYGFTVVTDNDITKNASLTLTYGRDISQRYILSFLRFQLLWVQQNVKPLYWIIKAVLKLRLNKKTIKQLIVNDVVPMDPEIFQKYMTYRQVLFQKK